MGRVFVYRYAGESKLLDKPEEQDERKPVPALGETVQRRGRTWRVDSVAYAKTIVPRRNVQTPLEFHITLVPVES